MKYISSEFKRYNANSRNRHTGDCVLRAISLAYGKDYDDIHKEINALKRKLGFSVYNDVRLVKLFIKRKGYEYAGGPDVWVDDNPTKLTISDFAYINPSGTYLILCGKNTGDTSHLVCLIDGDIYDSWDSSNEAVTYAYRITSDKSDSFDTSNIDYVDQLEDEISHVLDKLLVKQSEKMTYATFKYIFADKEKTQSGHTVRVWMTIDTEDMVAYNGKYYKDFVIKLNPRRNYGDQVTQLVEKLRVAVREWIYSYRHDIEDLRKMQNVSTHPKFYGSRLLLSKLPDWSHSLIYRIYDNGEGSREWTDRYEIFMDPLPDDPRAEELGSVRFREDTIPALRNAINNYKLHYWRADYDY